MTADQIVQMLAAKHREDVFVPECKTGPSQYQKHLRMDAWAMKKSWANPRVVAYEVKVSRSDFLRDEKWTGYLDYCNELCFVAPTGVIDPAEVPEQAGLILVAKTGTRLFTKKKAPYRDVEIPEELWRHILFSRAQITREHQRLEGRPYWERWLEDRKKDREVGSRVAYRLSEIVRECKYEASQVARQRQTFEEYQRQLQEAGLNPYSPKEWQVKRDIKRHLDRLRGGLPPHMKSNLARAVASLETAIKVIEIIEAEEKAS